MSEKVEKAVEYMRGDYSCSQAVMCAFCEDAGISHEEAKKLGAPYSGGRKIKCGGVFAAELVLTAKYGEHAAKKLNAEFEKRFINKIGAINCRDIKDHQLSPCIGCVEESAKILEELLTK